MSVASCFWALLSLENFEFIYLPDFVTDVQIAFGKTPGDILLSHSLLYFIHPDELSLAKTDLMNFVRIKTLAGAVTRCRLKSIKSIIYQDYGDCHNMQDNLQDWIITDVVMYTATNKTILTFFHSHEIEINDNATTFPSSSCCGSRQFHFNESNMILNILQLHSLPMTLDDPFRIFQIYDTTSKQLIISWPSCLNKTLLDDSNDVVVVREEESDSCYGKSTSLLPRQREKFIESASQLANLLTVREMEKRIEHPQLSKTDAVCTHHCHSNSTAILEPYGLCQVERIIITYGSLTFSSFQVTPVEEHNTRSYHHYMYCTPGNNNHSARSASTTIMEDDRRNIPTTTTTTTTTTTINNKFKRKSNINDILNSNNNNNNNNIPPITNNNDNHNNNNNIVSPIIPYLQQQQYHNPSSLNNNTLHHHHHNIIPKKYTNNNNAIIDNTEQAENSTMNTNNTTTKSPLPRAWRGRFGAYEKKCENCQTNTSPEWRRGPSGHKTLCNACGLRYARLVAKHERQQGPKEEEERSLLLYNNNKLKNSNSIVTKK